MSDKVMTYSEAIEKVLLDNGYFAPLKKIYKEIVKYRILTGKTPFNTIQAIIQRNPKFIKIGLGTYALTEYLHKLPKTPTPKTLSQKEDNKHTAIQGMLIEIGNAEGYDTYSWDKRAIFENKTLSNLMTLEMCPPFTYETIIRRIERIDVLWFNVRHFPEYTFEVEHTPQFKNSLLKFTELCDFSTLFYIVAYPENEDKYRYELSRPVFREIKDRCVFKSYDQVEQMYLKSIEKMKVSTEFFLR